MLPGPQCLQTHGTMFPQARQGQRSFKKRHRDLKKKKNTNKSISWGSQIKAQRPLLVLGQQQLLMQAWRPSSSGQGALGFRAAVCFKASPLSREKQSPENALAGFLDALSQCSPSALAAAQALLLSHGLFSG